MHLLPDLGTRTLIMGILNVTPDSFSDGGDFTVLDTAVRHAADMVAEGADIIDVGGESTRPTAMPVPTDEEIARVVPVIARLAPTIGVPISIDTYKAATAEAALAAGARIVNDIWGFSREPDIARVAAAHKAAVVIMHNRTTIDADIDIIEDMKAFFGRAIDVARKAGIADDDIILDPGVGFGKTPEQHVEAIARLGELLPLGYPLLMGTSRKSVIGFLTGNRLAPRERLFGTIASNVAAILGGADIVRVHDVRAHKEAALVADALRSARR